MILSFLVYLIRNRSSNQETMIRPTGIETTILGSSRYPLVSSSKKRNNPADDAGSGALFFLLLLI